MKSKIWFECSGCYKEHDNVEDVRECCGRPSDNAYHKAVYCIDCKHIGKRGILIPQKEKTYYCAREVRCPVSGEMKILNGDCDELNKDYQCQYFEFKEEKKDND